MNCCAELECVKTEGLQLSYSFTDDFDLTGYSAEIRIALSEGDTVLLTAAGTVAVRTVSFYIPPATLQTLPNGVPVSAPWIGAFEVNITSPASFVTRLDFGTIVVEKGV
jgi:hypothetical protein